MDIGYHMHIISKIANKRDKLVIAMVFAFLVLGISVEVHQVVQTSKKETKAVVVIDCGHGGIDPGKVGINGVYEKDINLAIGKYLKEALIKDKCQVIMTRESDTGLYQETDTNKKIADLNKRIEIMNHEDVDCVVSVHQNSFTGEASRGAQVFFQTGSEDGEQLAKILQDQLISSVDTSNHRQAKSNASYYLLKKTTAAAVIVECGFLSNSQEAEKLCQKAYQRQIAWAIAQGIMQYVKEKRQG